MSMMLKLSIQADLDKCRTVSDIEQLKERYRYSFVNAVDATEFNRMIKESLSKKR